MSKKKIDYNALVGLRKTAKNMAVMFGVPAIMYFLSQAEVWVPKDCLPWAIPVAAALTYLLKNYVENR